MNVTQFWNDMVGNIITFLPKLGVFLLILIIGWLVARAVRKVVQIILHRLHFDRAVERGGIKRALSQSQYDASGLIAALVYYAVLLVALQLAFGVFGPNPVSAILAAIVAWLPRAIVAVVIIIVAAAVASALRDLVGGAMGGLSYGPMVAKIVQVFVIAFGVIAALNQIGVATAVTGPVLIALLATIGGVVVVGAGGGLMRPMQQRWDRWLNRAEEEIPSARTRAEAYQRGKEDALRQAETGAPQRVTEPATPAVPQERTGRTPPA